jgi:hypothetical protein
MSWRFFASGLAPAQTPASFLQRGTVMLPEKTKQNKALKQVFSALSALLPMHNTGIGNPP